MIGTPLEKDDDTIPDRSKNCGVATWKPTDNLVSEIVKAISPRVGSKVTSLLPVTELLSIPYIG